MAHITGKKPECVYHKITNCHVYENQIDTLNEQLIYASTDGNDNKHCPELVISDRIKTFDDLMTATLDDFEIVGEVIKGPKFKYPLTV
jgi:thymidylate synthase